MGRGRWAAAAFSLATLWGCKAEQKAEAPPPQPLRGSTIDFLAQGSSKACAADDVKATLLSMMRPDTAATKALANAGTYPFHSSDVDAFAAAINMDLQLETLASVNRNAHGVKCEGQIAVAAPAYKVEAPAPVPVEYEVRPSAEDPSSFVISANSGLAKAAAQDLLDQIVQQIVARAGDVAAQKAAQFAAAGAPPLPAVSPSFDCSRVTSAVLRTICGSDRLIALDNQLSGAYRNALNRLRRATSLPTGSGWSLRNEPGLSGGRKPPMHNVSRPHMMIASRS